MGMMPRLMRVDEFIKSVDSMNTQPIPRTDLDLSPILEQFGTWAVTTYGLECVTHYYPIEKARLLETDWVEHMAEKDWVILKDFVRALKAARKHFKSRI